MSSAEGKKGPLEFNLFAQFATKELTHAGIWAWILQSLDESCPPEYIELQPAANALLAEMSVGDFGPAVKVKRERKLPGNAGRVDIEAVDGSGRVVVIEVKVLARPDHDQRNRYATAYRSNERQLVAMAIMTTRYEEVWGSLSKSEYIGPKRLLEALRASPCTLDLMRQYRAWLESFVDELETNLAAIHGDDPEACARALTSDAAQWSFMHKLGDDIGGPSAADLYAGTSIGGTPWTQLAFSQGRHPEFDALFYRLESFGNHAAEFTLRQYQKPIQPGKRDRLLELRRMFGEAAAECGASSLFDMNPRGARLGAQEAKVAQVTTRGGRPALGVVLEQLPAVHTRFIEKLRKVGWPLGPELQTVVSIASTDSPAPEVVNGA